jgi:HK97 family phage major capsid protein
MNKEQKLLVASELQKLYKPSNSKQLITKTSAGIGEDGSGANLTRPEILKDILRPNFLEGTIFDRCRHIEVSDRANGLFTIITKQTERTITNGILGGVQTYYEGEGDTINLTNGQFYQDRLNLNYIAVATVATNAMLQDSIVLEEYISNSFEEAIRYKVDNEILYGANATGCNGILYDGDRATKYVTLANPITVPDLKNMMHYYYGGKNGCWVVAYDMWGEIIDLYANTLPLRFYKDGTITLFGYPVIVKDDMRTRSIVLGDFSQYAIGLKPIREEVSEHLYFLSAQTAFRANIRINGMPTWVDGINTESGRKVYPFVASAIDDTKSSSSSSSTELKSSSSSSNSSSSSSTSSSTSSSSSSHTRP